MAICEYRRENPKLAQVLLSARADPTKECKGRGQLLVVVAKQISRLVGERQVKEGNESGNADPESICEETVCALLDGRASVNAHEPQSHFTALHYAAQHSHKL